MPIDTTNLRDQHQALLRLAGDLKALLEPAKLERDPAAARAVISKLVGKLQVHLAMEDHSLYPALLLQPDAALRDKARRYQTEMGGIKETVTGYARRWQMEEIKKDASGFVAETRGLLGALSHRIEVENLDLFFGADCVP